MSTHILQFVWPIVDESHTRTQLIADGAAQLDDLADQAHAVITGPPLWDIQPAAQVPGWAAHAPGSVLIVRVPVDRYGPVHEHRTTRPEPDPAAMQRLIDGDPPARVRATDRTAAMAQMARTTDVHAVASRFHVKPAAVHQAMYRHRTRQAA
ncbi:hypothetical protein [Micromonospora cathayae]|uniref:Uncharacterized protein n=1 Tax=Micromonospora cathayae TaxID=3028804 RepID=A0ABY7ZVX7_9ACTN|nr:hypothetical protein [Micromonospora sp. HUAS 3]WDZ87215.1 hypothetical protein PVK37_12805 [Micromonospora sp. HUAS 3]